MRIALAAIGALGVLAFMGVAHADVRDLEWGTCVASGVTQTPEASAAACTEIIQGTITVAYVYRGPSSIPTPTSRLGRRYSISSARKPIARKL